MIRLHHSPQTRSMRSLWLLNEIGVPFDLVTYPFDASLKTAEYRTLNPAGRVPTLELDGEVLFESGAIAERLCELYSPEVMGRSPDHDERAGWLNWIHYAETISQHVAALTQQHIALFEDHMRSPVIMKIEARRLAKTYAAVDAALAGRNSLLPSGFSAADVGVGQAIYMGRHFAPLDGFENLQRWYAALEARPAFQAALPGEMRLYAKDFYPPWEDAK